MKKRKHVNAIFIYNENPSILISDAQAFYTALITSPGNTHVTIAPATMTAAQGRISSAQTAQINTAARTRGLADARDLAFAPVITDIQNFVALVQTAANSAPDELTAITIVTECGLHTRNITPKIKGYYKVINDATTAGMLDITFKAASKGFHACYETQESIDGITWVTVKTSPDSHYKYAHGKTAGTKLYFRGRVILSEKKGGAQAWIYMPDAFLFVR